jgi:hypothetical protein
MISLIEEIDLNYLLNFQLFLIKILFDAKHFYSLIVFIFPEIENKNHEL